MPTSRVLVRRMAMRHEGISIETMDHAGFRSSAAQNGLGIRIAYSRRYETGESKVVARAKLCCNQAAKGKMDRGYRT